MPLNLAGLITPQQSSVNDQALPSIGDINARAAQAREQELRTEQARIDDEELRRDNQILSELSAKSMKDGVPDPLAFRKEMLQHPQLSWKAKQDLDAKLKPLSISQFITESYQRRMNVPQPDENGFMADLMANPEIGVEGAMALRDKISKYQSTFGEAERTAELSKMSAIATSIDNMVADGKIDAYDKAMLSVAMGKFGVPDAIKWTGDDDADLQSASSFADAFRDVDIARARLSSQREAQGIRELSQAESTRHNREQEAIAWYRAKHPSTTGAIGLNGPLTTGQSQLVDRQVEMIISGSADPSMADLSGRGGMASLKPYIEYKIHTDYPGFDLLQAQGDRKYWSSDKTKRNLQVMNVVSEQLPKLLAASDIMKRMGIPRLDRSAIDAMAQAGDPDAANYVAASTVSVEDIAKAISGGNALTDDQLELAQRMIPLGATVEQLDRIIRQISDGVDSRKMTIYHQGGMYGRIAAKNDPFLSEKMREKIMAGNFGEEKPSSKPVEKDARGYHVGMIVNTKNGKMRLEKFPSNDPKNWTAVK